jgi:hypothetical protein
VRLTGPAGAASCQGAPAVQADQAGRAFGCLPGQPGTGLSHDLAGALDRDRQLIQRPPQPAPDPAAEGFGNRAAAVAQHRGGLRCSLLRPIGQLTGHPADRLGALFPAQLAAGAQLGGDLPDPPPVCHRLPVAPPAACTRRTVRTSLPTALASSPESVG